MSNSGNSKWVCVEYIGDGFTVGKSYGCNDIGQLIDDQYCLRLFPKTYNHTTIKFIEITFDKYLKEIEMIR